MVVTGAVSMLSSNSRKDGAGIPALAGTDSRIKKHRPEPATDWVSGEQEQTHN